MIVIHNFKEAHQLYQQGRIPFRLIQEQAMVLIGINSGRHIDEAFDIGNDDIEWLLQQPEEDYNGMLGGDVHVCESEADLLEVVGIDMEFAAAHDNRWPNVTDQVMSWDQCCRVQKLAKRQEGASVKSFHRESTSRSPTNCHGDLLLVQHQRLAQRLKAQLSERRA